MTDLIAQASRDWPEDFAHENGDYFCVCEGCGNRFRGYKRRIVCKVCAAAMTAQPPAAQPVAHRYMGEDGWIYAAGVPEFVKRAGIQQEPLYLQPDPRIAKLEADLAAAQTQIAALDADLTQAVQMYTDAAGERDKALSDLAAAQAERDALLRIKDAADVLYSEAEEYDLPDGVGMGASQEYWDDLANALFPDDSGGVIQADLKNVQAAVDWAWEAFNEELNKPEFLPCGHHHSLMLKSAETGEPLYCELCDCISRRNDAEKMETEARAYAHNLAVSIYGQHYLDESPNWRPLPDLMGLLTQIDNMYAGLRNDLEALKVENKRLVGLPLAPLMAERDALRAAWETAKRQNSHDMLLSGDEIHQHNEAIWIAGGRK